MASGTLGLWFRLRLKGLGNRQYEVVAEELVRGQQTALGSNPSSVSDLPWNSGPFPVRPPSGDCHQE